MSKAQVREHVNMVAVRRLGGALRMKNRGVTMTDETFLDVQAPLEVYFQGHALGDGAIMRKAFLPTAHIEGVRDGVFTSWTVDEYCGRFSGTPAADESERRRTVNAIDVSDDAAMAKATLVHGALTFTDYFVLLRSDGVWRIANKVYTIRST
jgi:hypothetical protein